MNAHPLKDRTLVFIGAGNMAEALVQGLLRTGVCPPERVVVTDVREERIQYFRAAFGVRAGLDNAAAAAEADVLVLAVKPQVMDPVLAGLAAAIRPEALVISIAAGLPAARIERQLPPGRRVVRVMPNTPSLVGAGMAALAPGAAAGPDDLLVAEAVMRAVGQVVRVEEKDLDAVTALSGSGPAYVFHLVEGMLAAAGRLGLDPAVARALVCATVAGAARLLAETGETPEALRARVTSRGGTTEAALKAMAGRGFRETVEEAVLAAHRRSVELSAL